MTHSIFLVLVLFWVPPLSILFLEQYISLLSVYCLCLSFLALSFTSLSLNLFLSLSATTSPTICLTVFTPLLLIPVFYPYLFISVSRLLIKFIRYLDLRWDTNNNVIENSDHHRKCANTCWFRNPPKMYKNEYFRALLSWRENCLFCGFYKSLFLLGWVQKTFINIETSWNCTRIE